MGKKGRYINQVLGVKIDCISQDEVLKKLGKWLDSRGKRYVVTPNVEMVMLAQKDKGFKRILNQADMALADGFGLRLGNRAIKVRVTGFETMLRLCEMAVSNSWRVFLLGGRQLAAEKAAEKLRQRWQGLEIKGFSGPEQLGIVSEVEKKQLVDKINEFRPHLLLVGFGHGKQERWIKENLGKLKIKVAMGVGGSFDMVVKPWLVAPRLVQRLGLGWLWRLILQPWRIKRQLVLVKFVWRVWVVDFWRGLGWN